MRLLRLIAVAVLVVGTAALAFAGGAQEAAGTGADTVEISLKTSLNEDSPEATHQAFWVLFREFQEENPNVQIDVEAVTHDVYQTKIKTLAAANELPTVFESRGSWVPEFTENELLRPLDDMFEIYPEWRSSFREGTFANYEYKGKTWGIPLTVAMQLFFYNKTIFDEVGIPEFPKTWAEFTDAVEKLRLAGYTPITLGNKGKWVVEYTFVSPMMHRMCGIDWYQNLRSRSGAKFTDSCFVEVLQKFRDLVELGAFNKNVNSIDTAQQRTAYYNGKAAMFMEGTWAVATVGKEAPAEIADATYTAVMPAVQGGKGDPNTTTGGSGWSWAVSADLPEEDAYVQAVAKLLRAIDGEEFARLVIEDNGFPAYNVQDYDTSKIDPLVKRFNGMMEDKYLLPVIDHQFSASVLDVLYSGTQELFIGTITPQQLAADIQEAYDKEQ
jgi:raffinose/stachyose/melibiose transport system substrate-binding protein